MDELESVIQFLNSIYPLSDPCNAYLRNIIKERSIKRGEFVLKPGQVSQNILFIKKGLLRSFYRKDGKDVSTWFMKKGDFMVSILSFYKRVPSKEYIQAIIKSEAFYMSHDELDYAYNNFLEFNFVGRELGNLYLVRSAEQLESIRLQSAEEKYNWLLSYDPDLLQIVPEKYLASYVDLTAVTVSKTKRKFLKIKKR